ncbi:hypothetical protein C7448_104218 [Tenacibaculum gallaicum]|uniref:Uncharacterized protein n=1 Tax=Tenacibaculum gallaicum TaxID=561505 RepID=A0A3E0HWH6_9FLAO|nr:hypothetical protein C7448_104218 [Tenacibaculum gallaicum]
MLNVLCSEVRYETVYIQSLPFSRLAGRVLAMAPQTGKGDRGEGSVLGGLGDILDGDNRF